MSNYWKESNGWKQRFSLKEKNERKFNVNLFTKKFYWVEQDCWVSLNISAAGLRTINKLGLDAAIKMAAEKGYLNA